MSFLKDVANTQKMLVEAIRSGDVGSEDSFIRRYQKGLVIMLQRRNCNKALAEDIAQDTLVTLLMKLRENGIENPALLDRYVHQTAKYKLIGWFRKLENQTEQRENFDDFTSEVTDIESIEIRNERSRIVQELIDSMKLVRDREVLFRFYVKDQTKPFICEAMELPASHFDRIISRARTRFQKLAKQKLIDLI